MHQDTSYHLWCVPADLSSCWAALPANVFGRYKRFKDTVMDEAYFPVLWTEDGYRTPGMDEYAATGSGAWLAA